MRIEIMKWRRARGQGGAHGVDGRVHPLCKLDHRQAAACRSEHHRRTAADARKAGRARASEMLSRKGLRSH